MSPQRAIKFSTLRETAAPLLGFVVQLGSNMFWISHWISHRVQSHSAITTTFENWSLTNAVDKVIVHTQQDPKWHGADAEIGNRRWPSSLTDKDGKEIQDVVFEY